MTWLTVSAVAELAGCSERAVRKAVAKGVMQGQPLRTTPTQSRGGRGGKSYLVHLSSLPEHIRARYSASGEPALPARIAPGGVGRALWYVEHIKPALEAPRGSRERAGIVKELAKKPFRHPDGSMKARPARTLNRWIAAYETQGVAGLARKGRDDKGAKRVVIGREIDKLIRDRGGDDALAKVDSALDSLIRGLHAQLETPKLIRFLGEHALSDHCAGLGLSPSASALSLPLHYINAPDRRRYRMSAKFRKDRKSYEDNMRPRVQRTIDGLLPMQSVNGDVTKLDMFLGDRDDLQEWAFGISWLDNATKRCWFDVVIKPKGKGITNVDVISSFVRMCRSWGLPKNLYIDNGGEYNFADMLGDLFSLLPHGMETHFENRSGVIRARPYNAAAKQIEGIFRVIERYLSALPGYAGGDRMKPRVATVSGKIAPYTRSLQDFVRAVGNAIALYNGLAQGAGAQLKGRSPNQAYQDAIEAGWTKTEIEIEAFYMAFSVPETRVLRQGSIKCDGELWTCPELKSHIGERVIILKPKYHGYDGLPVQDELGRLIGIARPQPKFGVLDPEGARWGAEATKRNRRATLAHLASAPQIDIARAHEDAVARLPPPPEAPVGARVTASDDAKAIAAGLKETAKQRRARESEESDREAREQLAALQSIFKTGEDAA